MFITRGDGYITTAQAGELVHRRPVTIRQWKARGHLEPKGLDEHGNLLFDPADVAKADKRVRENALRTNGTDPRRIRAIRPEAA